MGRKRRPRKGKIPFESEVPDIMSDLEIVDSQSNGTDITPPDEQRRRLPEPLERFWQIYKRTRDGPREWHE